MANDPDPHLLKGSNFRRDKDADKPLLRVFICYCFFGKNVNLKIVWF